MAVDDTPGAAASRAFDYDRTVALSDGVFAIALTLLILTISFPALHNPAHGHLGAALEHRGSEFFSYALSFAVLGLLWLRHHAFFRELRRIDTTIAVLNLVYLAVIAFLPYPTRLLGVYGDHAVAVAGYALTILVIGLISVAMRLHGVRARIIDPPSAASWTWQLATPGVFLISVPIALLSPTAAKWSWLLLALAPWAARRTLRPRTTAADWEEK